MDRRVPVIVQEQYEAAMRKTHLTREEAEGHFPELLDWLLQNVSLADVVRDSGVSLKLVSPDSIVGLVGDCLFCEVST